jgi:hypothetical protein
MCSFEKVSGILDQRILAGIPNLLIRMAVFSTRQDSMSTETVLP